MSATTSSPKRGAAYGLVAAALFGLSAPLAKLILGADVSPVLLAGLLYLGAAIGLSLWWLVSKARAAPEQAEAPLQRADLSKLAGVVFTGGILAPVLMLMGLSRVSALAGSLLLNLEAPFTVLLAVVVFREHLGRYAGGAAFFILLGALLLKLEFGALGLDTLGADGLGVLLLASACLPRIHHSVEIDGEPYWDGGYSANPAVFPLFYDCTSRDILLVLLDPLRHERTPQSKDEIDSRIGELSFSANFMREMRMFAQATDFARPGFLRGGRLERRLRAMRFHMIDSDQVESLQRSDTKLIAYAPFLELLRAQGHERATQWLGTHGQGVGKHSTIDVKALFT